MMKKIMIGFFATALLISITGYAKKSRPSIEERRQARFEKRKARKEKMQQRREERKKKSIWSKLFKKEQKQKSKQEKARLAQAKAAQQRYDKEMKKARKLEAKARYERTRQEKIKLADARRQMREYELSVAHKRDRATRETLMDSWKGYRKNEVAREYADGKYADLYRQPAWPFYMLYTEDGNKDLFQVNIDYQYATDSYDSDGSTRDVTALTFGEKPIQWQDMLLALRLDKKGVLASPQALNPNNAATRTNASDPQKVAWSLIKENLADKNILFFGETNKLETSINFFRYIKDKDLAIGVEVPFGYKSHRLKLDTNIDSHAAIKRLPAAGGGFWGDDVVFKVAAAYGTVVNVLEKTLVPETLNYLLAPKGLSYLPKTSITGIGDVSTFLNYYIPTRYLERFLVGAKVTWPTAKDASTSKVWAPQLGSGFTRLSAYTSMLFNHQRKYFNPHMFIQASWNLPGHKKTRVPKIIKFDGSAGGTAVNLGGATRGYPETSDGTKIGDLIPSYGERVLFYSPTGPADAAIAFTEYDTQIPHFADNVQSVRVTPGPEVEMRLGNLWDQLILRRDSFDIYYNFRAKWKDYIGGNLPRDVWAVDLLKDDTYQLEHKLGADYIYQFDAKTRMNLGCSWIFAGRNVPATFEARLAAQVEF